MRSGIRSHRLTPYMFLLPGLALYVLWMIYPLVYELYISFFKWNIMPGQPSTFIGLENYQTILSDRNFWLALKNTAQYTAITVAGQMIFGLAVALLVHRVTVGRRLFRAIYYLPVVTSWVVVSFLFQFLFSSNPGGLMNYLLVEVIHLLPEPVDWLGNAGTAWIAIYTLGIWKGIGWSMVIFLAALQGIPPELYEVAAIDGANEWGQFRHITLPLIRPTTLFVLVMLIIGGFNVFLSVFLITGGGPLHRTEVVLSYMYNRAFGRLDFGYGAALSYILAAIVISINFVQMRLLRGPEVQY
ncbi:MAG: sugar ABC transporter permease [Anaerolineae bacterium]